MEASRPLIAASALGRILADSGSSEKTMPAAASPRRPIVMIATFTALDVAVRNVIREMLDGRPMEITALQPSIPDARSNDYFTIIPAKAGFHVITTHCPAETWVPAFAGTTPVRSFLLTLGRKLQE
jgi:hypothetical protein